MAMPKPQTNKGKPDELRNDPTPPLDDDVEVNYEAAPAPAPSNEGEGEDLPPPQPIGDPRRDAITQRYRELQAEEQAKVEAEGGSGLDLDAPLAPPAPVAGEPEPEPAPEPITEPGEDRDLALSVYGERLVFKRSELEKRFGMEGFPDDRIISVAQKEMAADQRLREAKEVADQRLTGSQDRRSGASEVGEGGPTDQLAGTEPDDANGLASDRPPQEPNQALPEEKLDEIVQRVQFGDADEAKQALREYAEVIRSSIPGITPEAVLTEFEQRLAQRQHQTEIFNALTKFGEDNPDLIADRHLITVGLNMAAEEMLEDLRTIGIAEKDLAPIAQDNQAIATAHRSVRLQGHQVRTVDQVLADAAGKMRDKYHLQKPAAGNGSQPHPAISHPGQARERMHRKEIAQPQPRHGGARVVPAQGAQRPKTVPEVIAEQRRARGFRN